MTVRGARTVRDTVEWVSVLGVAVAVALLVKAFALQAFYIPSESMENTLFEDDRVLVNKLAYRVGDIERGDVIVFERPPTLDDPSVDNLIKRVIALPGDQVENVGDDVYVNGERLDEPYLKPGSVSDGVPTSIVGAGRLWVMGDNRNESCDSRCFGEIDQDLVVGKAFLRAWPLDQIGAL